jgi:hypothetical protein
MMKANRTLIAKTQTVKPLLQAGRNVQEAIVLTAEVGIGEAVVAVIVVEVLEAAAVREAAAIMVLVAAVVIAATAKNSN